MSENILFVQTLETGRKASLLQYFLVCCIVSANNFMFNDNVPILCLSCNVKKSKPTAKLSENSWNKLRSNRFQWCHLWRQRLYWYRFCLSNYIYQVPEKLYWVQDETTLKYIWPPLLGLKITQLQDKICYTYNIWYSNCHRTYRAQIRFKLRSIVWWYYNPWRVMKWYIITSTVTSKVVNC